MSTPNKNPSKTLNQIWENVQKNVGFQVTNTKKFSERGQISGLIRQCPFQNTLEICHIDPSDT